MANGYRYSRRLMGPIVLITIGILFLLDQIGYGDWNFGRTWPVILIVVGAVKIFERFIAPPAPIVPPPGPTPGWQPPSPGQNPPGPGAPGSPAGTNEPPKS
ncbi:MAG: DUF5668 domain-containing protein [Acidobacteriia bacterium]|nr:DUF5668 domain-containing protein [Terriglobia bacterium]